MMKKRSYCFDPRECQICDTSFYRVSCIITKTEQGCTKYCNLIKLIYIQSCTQTELQTFNVKPQIKKKITFPYLRSSEFGYKLTMSSRSLKNRNISGYPPLSTYGFFFPLANLKTYAPVLYKFLFEDCSCFCQTLTDLIKKNSFSRVK